MTQSDRSVEQPSRKNLELAASIRGAIQFSDEISSHIPKAVRKINEGIDSLQQGELSQALMEYLDKERSTAFFNLVYKHPRSGVVRLGFNGNGFVWIPHEELKKSHDPFFRIFGYRTVPLTGEDLYDLSQMQPELFPKKGCIEYLALSLESLGNRIEDKAKTFYRETDNNQNERDKN